ncbi:MAG: VWA domain-containing protein [Gammaproteobacteria bacterium]|nr:VWA domain-containing protein [Gammaproteobacteria bacterium]
MSEFHLLRPYWLLLLVPALLLLWRLTPGRHGGSPWSPIIDASLLDKLQITPSVSHSLLPYRLLSVGWLLAIVALAGPTWERQPTPTWQQGTPLVLILDLSSSMNQTTLPPSRLERARFKILDLLKQRKEGRTALIVFSAEPFLVTPLTDDVDTIRNLLSALSTEILPTDGDRAAPALQMGVELLVQSQAGSGDLLLLTDGVLDIADTLTTSHQLQQRGHRLSLLSIGNPETIRQNQPPLQSLAQTGGGVYASLSSDERDIHQLLPSIDHTQALKQAQEQTVERWVEAGVWLLLPLLLLAATGFRRGWLTALLLFILPPLPPAHAFEWEDLWLRQDQQASQTLSQGDHQAAASQFEHHGWRGSALYQGGDYGAATEAFSLSTAPDAPYNRGNALAKSDHLEEAVEAYQQMLQQEPNHRDALSNLQLVQQLLQQKRQQQQPQNGEDETADEETGEEETGDKETSEESQAQQGDTTEPTPEQQRGDEPTQDAQQQEARPESPPTDAITDAEAARIEEDQAEETPDVEESSQEEASPPTRQPSPATKTSTSEEDIALKQWLRQISDDPSGLLRRKFMLQHLLRKQGQ